jgi:hypothetical protein
VAQYTVNTTGPATVQVEFGPDTTYGFKTSSVDITNASGGTANILVAGMKQSTQYHMRAIVTGGTNFTDTDRVFTTAAITEVQPQVYPVTRPTNAAPVNSGIEWMHNLVMGPSSKLTAVATDLDGNPIWYYDTGAAQGLSPYTMKLLNNGHVLLSISQPPTASTLIREIDLAGNTIRELNYTDLNSKLAAGGFNLVTQGFHHDFVPMDNGHVLVLMLVNKDFTDLPGYPGTITVSGDAIVDLDENWNPVWAWNAFDWLDVNRHLEGLPDWTHSNALLYDDYDGNLLLSMRHQSWLIKINYGNGLGDGSIAWKLGWQGDFTLSGDDPSQWFYAAHYPSMISRTGSQLTFSYFDNGNLRVLDNSGTMCVPFMSPPCYSRATVFQIDEQAKTAQVNWQDLPNVFSFWGGSISQLENGNIEFAMSQPYTDPTSSVIMEVTQTPTPQVVWQMSVDGVNTYRGYRIPSLYPGISW